MSTKLTFGGLSRRDFLRATAGVAGMTALAACAAPAAAPAGGEGSTASSEVVEITFMGWGGTEEDEGVKSAIEQFESEQDGIKVTWLHTPDQYLDKLVTNIAAGTPPDTSFVGAEAYGTFVKQGLLMDITDNVQTDSLMGAPDYFIQPQEEQRCAKDGKWYGIGSCWVAPHIYYNADIFAEEGIEPPSNDPDLAWTWDHFLEVATALTLDANGRHPNDADFDPENIERWGVDWPTGTLQIHSAILGNGGDWLDENGHLIIDQPAATEAIQNIADLVLKHHVKPAGTSLEALGMSNSQMLDNGRLAMVIDGSWALSWIYKISPKLGTAALPRMGADHTGTAMTAHLHSAYASTAHPEAAWEWVRFLSTPFYQTQFCKIGLWLPSQTALMTEEGLSDWITEGVHPEGYVDIPTKFVKNYGQSIYQPAGWPEANQLLTPGFDKVWIGDATAEEAMAEVVPAANAIFDEQAG